MRRLLGITLALLATLPAAAQTVPSPAPAVTAAPSPAALRIATRLASEEVVVAQTRRMLRQQLPAAMSANPDMKKLEQQLPGVTAEMIATMEPIILASLIRRLPAYQREVAAVYQRRLTPDELVAVGAFYESPTGARLLTLVRDGVDYSALLDKQLRSGGEAPISRAELAATITPAVQPAVAGLSDAEQLALLRFGMTTAGRKLVGINQELLELAVSFNNKQDEAAEKELDVAMTALIERRMAARKK